MLRRLAMARNPFTAPVEAVRGWGDIGILGFDFEEHGSEWRLKSFDCSGVDNSSDIAWLNWGVWLCCRESVELDRLYSVFVTGGELCSTGRLRFLTILNVLDIDLRTAPGDFGSFGTWSSSSWSSPLQLSENGSVLRNNGRFLETLWETAGTFMLLDRGGWMKFGAMEVAEVDGRRGQAKDSGVLAIDVRGRPWMEWREDGLLDVDTSIIDGRPEKTTETILAVSSWLFLRTGDFCGSSLFEIYPVSSSSEKSYSEKSSADDDASSSEDM